MWPLLPCPLASPTSAQTHSVSPTEPAHTPEFSRMACGSGPTQVLPSLPGVFLLCFIGGSCPSPRRLPRTLSWCAGAGLLHSAAWLPPCPADLSFTGGTRSHSHHVHSARPQRPRDHMRMTSPDPAKPQTRGRSGLPGAAAAGEAASGVWVSSGC